MKNVLAVIALILLLVSPVWAEDIYIAQSSAGGDTGANCANAHAITWFNTAGNWGADAGDITAGDTVYFCGTLTSTATVQGSGSAGSPITLKFSAGANFTSTTNWGTGASAAIYATGKDYITIDGNNVGIIANTSNGDGESHGVSLDGCDNAEIKNLTVQNIYVHEYDVGGLVHAYGIQAVDCNSLSIHNNTINNAYIGINVGTTAAAAMNDVDIYSNTISSCNWGIGVALGTDNSSMDDVKIYSNNITMGYNWYDTADENHANGMHIFGRSTYQITNLQIYSNIVAGNCNVHTTGYIFIELDAISPKIYNNLLVGVTNKPANGYIYIKATSIASSPLLYNNTIVGSTSGGNGMYLRGDNTHTYDIRNNIFTLLTAGIYAPDDGTVLTSDYNLYYSNTNLAYLASGYTTLADWRTALGGCPGSDNECSSVAADPLFISTSDFRLQSGSPAKWTGTNLSATFTTDILGLGRGFWDIGAYSYISNIYVPWAH
jgi:hypothetical protein